MTFNENANVSGNRAPRGGTAAAMAGGRVVGLVSSARRQRCFDAGDDGGVGACDTFSIAGGAL